METTKKTTSLEGLTEVNKIINFKHFQKKIIARDLFLGFFGCLLSITKAY